MYQKYKKLIWGGGFAVLLAVQSLTGFDIGALVGIDVVADPETGHFSMTVPQQILTLVNSLAVLVGIYKPTNAPST